MTASATSNGRGRTRRFFEDFGSVVRRSLFDMVDDELLYRSFSGLQLQSKLLDRLKHRSAAARIGSLGGLCGCPATGAGRPEPRRERLHFGKRKLQRHGIAAL